ncbi:hypothetical protein NUSPORA_01195 [Nucleospora cyclopteri]
MWVCALPKKYFMIKTEEGFSSEKFKDWMRKKIESKSEAYWLTIWCRRVYKNTFIITLRGNFEVLQESVKILKNSKRMKNLNVLYHNEIYLITKSKLSLPFSSFY